MSPGGVLALLHAMKRACPRLLLLQAQGLFLYRACSWWVQFTRFHAVELIICFVPASLCCRYDSQYLIPMLGMLLGNSCSSVAVGLSAVLDDLSSGKEKVEALLALGASRVEATREVVTRAARLALTPLLNSLNVVGIVSIPVSTLTSCL